MNFTVLLGIWAAVFLSLVVVTALRYSLGRSEDDRIHIMDGERQLVVHQSELAHKLDVLDRWRTILLVVTIAYGLGLAGLHMYNVWQYGSTSHVG